LFPAIWKTVQKAINIISHVLLVTAIFFAVTGIVFPFVYGVNEIMASIGRFAIAIPTFIVGAYLQLLVTPPRRSRLRYDPALIDDNERRLQAVQDGAAIDAALAHARDQQLAWWVNHRS
jgi:hypothetical protein